MNKKWLILLALALSLLTGCQLSQTEAEPPTDGQAGEDVVGVKASNFVVDEGGNAYYSKRGDASGMVCRDTEGNESTFAEWSRSIILSGDWLYYRSVDDKLYKIRTDKSEKTLLRDKYTDRSMMLVGNSIYFQDSEYGYSISRVDLNGENFQTINGQKCHGFVGYKDNWLYYVRSNYHYKTNKLTKTELSLYKMRADGSEITLISEYNTGYIFIDGDSIYYHIFSLDGYAEDIYRTDLNGGNLTQLHLLPQDSGLPYEVAFKDGWVYYSYFTAGFYDGSDLHRVRADGTGDEMIFAGQIKDVQFSGDWMFCFDEETKYWYKLRPDGTEREQLYPDSMMVTGPGI
ncbi:MAG TPA: DUF5050 domain-containing protein [Terriglobales bacterium]|nr:DUF5050 domain-containing protein [Terriglobales bacterium]